LEPRFVAPWYFGLQKLKQVAFKETIKARMEEKAKEINRPQRDYLNIIYFVDSDKTRSIRLPLFTYKALIIAAVLLVAGAIFSVFSLTYYSYENSKLENSLIKAKQYLFDYQVRFDNIFDFESKIEPLVVAEPLEKVDAHQPQPELLVAKAVTPPAFPVEIIHLKWSVLQGGKFKLEFGVRNNAVQTRSIGRVWAKITDVAGEYRYFPTSYSEKTEAAKQQLPGYAISNYKSFEFSFDPHPAKIKSATVFIQDEQGGYKEESFSIPSGKRIQL
jgi:hypothetical protein